MLSNEGEAVSIDRSSYPEMCVSWSSLGSTKDTLSRGRHTLIILPFIYCDMILDRNDPLPRVIRQTSGSFKIRIN